MPYIGIHNTLTCGLQFMSNFAHLHPLTLHYIGMHNTLTCRLQFMTSAKLTQLACWHCKHCGATNHYPDNCPFHPNFSPTITGEQRAITGGKPNSGSYMEYHPNQPPKNRSLVRTSTTTLAATQIVNLPTAVSTVEPTTQSKTVKNTA